MKITELKTTKDLVKSILESNEKTRSNDMLLYYEVCKILNEDVLDAPFGGIILMLDKCNLPPFESVRRSRQKIQAEFPHLAASPEIQIFRAENEETYRDFARCGR